MKYQRNENQLAASAKTAASAFWRNESGGIGIKTGGESISESGGGESAAWLGSNTENSVWQSANGENWRRNESVSKWRKGERRHGSVSAKAYRNESIGGSNGVIEKAAKKSMAAAVASKAIGIKSATKK
jgi:hypothetical protein